MAIFSVVPLSTLVSCEQNIDVVLVLATLAGLNTVSTIFRLEQDRQVVSDRFRHKKAIFNRNVRKVTEMRLSHHENLGPIVNMNNLSSSKQ